MPSPSTTPCDDDEWRDRAPPPRTADFPSIADVIEQTILRAFGLGARSLRSPSRGRAEIAFARQVAIYIAHVQLGLTLTEASRLFDRDRTTGAHACRLVEDRRDDRRIDRTIEAIEVALDRSRIFQGAVFGKPMTHQPPMAERLQ